MYFNFVYMYMYMFSQVTEIINGLQMTATNNAKLQAGWQLEMNFY